MFEKLKELQEKELYILCFIAYCGDRLDYFSLVRFIAYQRIYTIDNSVLYVLKEKGFINFTRAERVNNSVGMINANVYFHVLHYLYTEQPEWVKDYQQAGVDISQLYMVLRNAVAYGLDEPSIIKPLQKKDLEIAYSYLLPVATDKDLYQLTRLVPDSYFSIFYCFALDSCIEADDVDKDEILPKLLNERSEDLSDEDRQFIKERLALFRYYAIGEYAPQGDGTNYYDCILRGLHEAHLGNQTKALSYLSNALTMPHKQVKVEGTLYGPLENLFLMALYSHNGQAGMKLLTQFYKHRNTYSYQEKYLPAYFIAIHEVDIKHNVSERWLEDLHIAGIKDNKKLYRALAIFFSNLWNKDIQPSYQQVYEPQMAILRFELSPFKDLPEEEQKILNQKYGKPILLQERPMSRWEHVLCDLEEERNKATDDPNAHDAERTERIGYFLRWGKIEVRKQVRLKSGKWSAGKEIDTYYYDLKQKYMDNIDREICQRCGESTSHLDKEKVLPYLIGSDRVYTGNSAPYAHVDIEEEKPYLIIHRKDDRFIVESNIPQVNDGQTDYVIEKTATLYHVIRLSVSQMVYYQKLLQLKSFPLSAEKRLRDFINHIGDVVEIHSDVIATDDDCETIESDGHLVVRITPQKKYGEYLLNFFAKPLEGGTSYQVPGKGTSIIIDEKDGVRYQVKRKLKAELQHQEELFTYIEELTGKDPTQYINELWSQQLLDLLSYISEQDAIDVEWPEGEEIRVRNMGKQEPWNVSLHEVAGWFEMEGEVHLDDGEVMDIARFLELSHDSYPNFVRLKGNEYLHLTEALRKQLNKLEAIATKVDGKMRISKMHANLLAEAVNGELAVKHSDELENLQHQIHESFELEAKKPRSLKATLRDYQMDGFQWMARLDSWDAGACLADDMGLGKTVQTIAMLLYKAKQGASLIVAPTSVVGNWRNELEKFAPSLEVFLVNEEDSKGRKAIVKKAKAQQVVLTTYGVLVKEAEVMSKKEWNIVCLDEAHTIKNKDTKMAQAAFGLQAHTRIALTGTPIQNHLGEVWSLFNFINPGMLGNYEGFQKKFVNQTEAGNKDRQHQLKRMLLPFILRRTKNEVIEELPDKTEVIRTVELSKDEMNTYELIRKRAKKQLEDERKVSVSILAEITKLRQAACATSLVDKTWDFPSSKLAELSELVDDICSDGNRVLVFSQFTSFLELVRQELDSKKLEYLYLDGSTSMKKRNDMVKQFQESDVPIFVISLKAGGLGLNLTSANYVIHCDPWWNPAIEQQATDRAYRIGQENKVTVYHLVSDHTIEQKIMRLHETKRNIADSMLDGSNVSHKLTEKELLEMLAG